MKILEIRDAVAKIKFNAEHTETAEKKLQENSPRSLRSQR